MLFDTYKYFLFFVIVYCFYRLLKSNTQKKLFLLIASYFFYMNWSVMYGLLLLMTTVMTFIAGRFIHIKKFPYKKVVLALSISYGLIVLGIFKYWDFLSHNLNAILFPFGHLNIPYLYLLLPVGISFYTFHTISYLIDSYRRRIKINPHFLDYALYVSFFPQLVSGPIVRASTFLPQLQSMPVVSKTMLWEGIILIFSGLFKKIVFANNLSPFVDTVFNNPSHYHGVSLIAGAYAFAIQIYADFSGYTDIAIGTSLLFGYILPANFNYPYLAENPSDFWARWHISLSTWLRDYLYIPLGGNRKGLFRTLLNLLIVMGLGGLWHGARWNFVLWGLYQGALLIIYRMLGVFKHFVEVVPLRLQKWLSIIIMLQFTVIGWILFRANSLAVIKTYFSQMVHFSAFQNQIAFLKDNIFLLILMAVFFVYHLSSTRTEFKKKLFHNPFNPWVMSLLIIGLFIMLLCSNSKQIPFIYFQF